MPPKTFKSKPSPQSVPDPCPCGRALAYAACCGMFHNGAIAPDAETLMRSRYSAYVLDLGDYVNATWAAETRPASLDVTPPRPQWLGLQVLAASTDGDTATVEFVARFKINGRAQRMHEKSRFSRTEGRWYYVDGVFPDAAEV